MSSSSSLPSTTPQSAGAIGATSPYYASSSILPSLMIIAALLAFVFLASVSIHLVLRFLADRSSSSAAPPRPRALRDEVHSAGTVGDTTERLAAAAERKKEEVGDEKQRLIDSLPLFTMASALAALPKSSPDCAVCLSPFTHDAELRLLPACRHAFHAACVDAWLRTTPSCPLCRAAVTHPHPSLSAMLAAAQPPPPEPRSRDRSRSFVVEIGTVSNRGSSAPAGGGDRNSRTYSLGSFDYHIDEEVEVVVSRVACATAGEATVKEENPAAQQEAPSPPGETVADAAGSSRGWLREYVDRLASSAYSLSERWSSRWSQSHQRQEEPWLWDAEAGAVEMSTPGPDEEETAFMVMYRWIAGV
ncbi:E3 ubiquitin-protein ligase ATL4-like [Phragmites australis]|uniref:E3 ubiquitin-protein ligase ATL4-like n=1 Tax=Phragmites australis TaxID=29695 RepID=UPI002D773F52|nr:E3 ubiquitin-protein ligase ATL4-like [Phragmites australis]